MTGPSPTSLHDLGVATARPIPLLSGWWIAAVVAACLLLDALLLVQTGLKVEGVRPLLGFLAWGVAASAICYRYRAPVTATERIVRDLVEGVSLFALVSLIGAIASYPLADGHRALVDPELEQIDLLFHFNWVSWYELVAGHTWVQTIERPAYLSIFATPALLIGSFAWHGRQAEIRLFIATFGIAELVTLALFPLFPAAGPLATLWHGAPPYMPLSALYQDQVILALRGHRLDAVDLGALHGLVSAPSFHAASAFIYMATAFRTRTLRAPFIILNILMLLATPVEGTHYLADLLSGGLVAIFALIVTPALVRLSREAGRRPGSFVHRLAVEAK